MAAQPSRTAESVWRETPVALQETEKPTNMSKSWCLTDSPVGYFTSLLECFQVTLES